MTTEISSKKFWHSLQIGEHSLIFSGPDELVNLDRVRVEAELLATSWNARYPSGRSY